MTVPTRLPPTLTAEQFEVLVERVGRDEAERLVAEARRAPKQRSG